MINYNFYTEKQSAVLKELRKTIPGELISYKELGIKAGLSNAARFVGTTMKNNNTPLLIPCHRVIRSNGKLGFYSSPGGTDQKDRYIKLEK
jgi:methylated-DNA-[protein]-cysteine S-methyltransferase